MRTALEQLPDVRRQDLERVLEILFRAFGNATRHRSTRRQGQILKVIVFGHLAGGGGSGDLGISTPDHHVLVVVGSEEHTNVADFWKDALAELDQAHEITHELKSRAHVVIHSLAEVNRELGRGRPYFVDIVRDGILLFEVSDEPLARPSKMPAHEAYIEATENFDEWSASASGFLRTAGYAIADGNHKIAAFLLHQTAERLYHCVLLTETLQTTRSHNLNFLRGQAERVAPELIPAWPRHSRFEERTWELLRRAYVDARFSKHFTITAGQLAWLVERLADLQKRVESSCREYLGTIVPAQHEASPARPTAVLQS